MLPTASNGRSKRGASPGGRLLKQAEPRLAGAAALLLLIAGTFLLHHRLYSQGSKAGSPLEEHHNQAQEALRRAHLLEGQQQRQEALVQDADKLADEVAELSKELSSVLGAADPSLTPREKLWHEKEKEQAGEAQEASGSAAGAANGGGSGAQGAAPGGAGGGGSPAAPGGGSGGGGAAAEQVAAARESILQELTRDRGTARREHPLLKLGGLGSGGSSSAAAERAGTPVVDNRADPVVVELSEEEVERRRADIVEAMRHAWGGYVRHAWGHDELAPVTQKGKDGFGGLGATIIDSLDTLLMMGMKEEYERGLKWIASSMSTTADFDASVFETIIRVVGGFMAAHEVTGDEALLRKSEEVAQRLMPAYNTTTGIPFNTINLKTQKCKNPNWNLKASTLAEFGTHQLEFYKLSEKTGNPVYAERAEATIRYLYDRNPGQGLMPLFVNPATGKFTSRKVSFGALGDSYYEYLLKLWVLKGRPQGDFLREMWEQAMDEMIDRLVFTSTDGLMYIAEYDRTLVKHKMDHLVCFVPGMLALGVYTEAVTGAKAERYMEVAAGVTHTCWKMYHTQPTGLSPEYVMFGPTGLRVGAAYNLLRPEALEAFWYMWRMTRDEKYRTWAWEVFQAFQKHCRTEAGYSGLKDVRKLNVTQDDTQQSFFLAETLKYLYLIYSPDDALDWDVWVLNTEAHPLRIVWPDGKPKRGMEHWRRRTQQQQQQQQQQQGGEQPAAGGGSRGWFSSLFRLRRR